MKPPELVIVSGVPHSGVPMITSALRQLRPALAEQAVISLGDVAATDPGFSERLEIRLPRSRRVAAQRAGGAQTVLVTGGALLGRSGLDDRADRLCPDAERQVAALVGSRDWAGVRLVVLTRRPDRLAEFAYADAVLAGASADLTDWIDDAASARFDQRALIERLAGLSVLGGVDIRPMELGGADLGTPERLALVRHVLAAIGVSAPEGALDTLELPRPRLIKPRGVDVARAMNAQLDTSVEHGLVADFVRDTFGSRRPEQLLLFTAEERSAFLAAQASRSEALFRDWFKPGPPDAYVDPAATAMLVDVAPFGRRLGAARLSWSARFRRRRRKAGTRLRAGPRRAT